jgi:NADH-quinone oxidoreductase subunit E
MSERALRIVDSFELSSEERHAIEHEMAHYPDPRAASIGALKIVQEKRGWVSDGAIVAVAEVLGIPAAELDGVATFYSLIFRRPVGRHVIKVCDSISCHLTGYEELRDALQAKLGIEMGQTTRDNRFTLIPICCLGACDRGPCLMLDDDTHGPVGLGAIDELLEAYK